LLEICVLIFVTALLLHQMERLRILDQMTITSERMFNWIREHPNVPWSHPKAQELFKECLEAHRRGFKFYVSFKYRDDIKHHIKWLENKIVE